MKHVDIHACACEQNENGSDYTHPQMLYQLRWSPLIACHNLIKVHRWECKPCPCQQVATVTHLPSRERERTKAVSHCNGSCTWDCTASYAAAGGMRACHWHATWAGLASVALVLDTNAVLNAGILYADGAHPQQVASAYKPGSGTHMPLTL
jgi:hypothetical protein